MFDIKAWESNFRMHIQKFGHPENLIIPLDFVRNRNSLDSKYKIIPSIHLTIFSLPLFLFFLSYLSLLFLSCPFLLLPFFSFALSLFFFSFHILSHPIFSHLFLSLFTFSLIISPSLSLSSLLTLFLFLSQLTVLLL